jgi:hypothetical protein
MGELQRQERVAGAHERQVHREVRGRARVRLNVGVLDTEQRPCPRGGQLLDRIDELLALVIALAGVPLGVLVVEHRTAGLEHSGGDVILRRNHAQLVVLALRFVLDQLGKVGVGRREVGQRRYVHGRLLTMVAGTQALRCHVRLGKLARRACAISLPGGCLHLSASRVYASA